MPRSSSHAARRRRWTDWFAAGNVATCPRCARPVHGDDEWDLDHLDPADDNSSVPAHRRCNRRHGRQLGGERTRELVALGREAERSRSDEGRFLGAAPPYYLPVVGALSPGRDVIDVIGRESDDPVWDRPWLDELRDVSSEGVWPRLMTAPHPAARGSYGAQAIADIEATAGRPLWWFQRLTIVRALEHDGAGELVWRNVGLTLPRQFGKSTLVGELASWRLRHRELFGNEREMILHVARDVAAAVGVQAPHRRRALADPDNYKVRNTAGRLEIVYLADDGEWMIRSSSGAYSYTVTMAIADEGWDLTPYDIDSGLASTLLQSKSAQLWLVSTSNQKATPLFPARRAQAIAELDSPSSLLWLEWSCRPGDNPGDPEVWRRSVPLWTPEIADRYADLYRSAAARHTSDPVADDPLSAFCDQNLNRWRMAVEVSKRKGEPLVDGDDWQTCNVDEAAGEPLVVAVEDHYGEGAAVAAVGCHRADPDRFDVLAELYDSRSEAFARAEELLELFTPSRLVVGASILEDPAARRLRAKPAGGRETAAGLPLLRDLVANGRITHADAEPLTHQLGDVRVTRTASGTLALVPGVRCDAVKATVWALHSMEMRRPRTPSIH